MQKFHLGDLESTEYFLTPLRQPFLYKGYRMMDIFRQNWEKNKHEALRLNHLINQERWWEAMDCLNRLDHPWWQSNTIDQREKVVNAIENLRDSQEHLQHGSNQEDLITGIKLDQEVQQQIQQGLDPWEAFQKGCSKLGGIVEEDGPESFCVRID